MGKLRIKQRVSIGHRYVQRKVIFRQWMFFIMFLVMMSISLYDLNKRYILPLEIGIGLLVGGTVGFIGQRIFNLFWNEEKQQIEAKRDLIGVVILILYLSFSFSRRWIFGHWIQGQKLSAFCFTTVAGAMTGRFVTTRMQIRAILEKQGIILRSRTKRLKAD
ncbi:hypothetical protein GS399_12920 [Pedobacter sp. HMF7647]|uniref:Uncharacterized protein n=1 Tax=Hufsiella arboris TaxID=2695275 RepID=A0A7K1YBT4_9SPHI|nr:hypothetical protein [Hufsiella arboris]MXV51880.1 hypothetical protein [Hufsiella arboris]